MSIEHLDQHLEEMVNFVTDFAHNNYLVPNAVPGGTIEDAIPYFKEQGFPQENIYDTAEIRQAVREILIKAFTKTTATPYADSKEAGQIILAGPLGSAARLRKALDDESIDSPKLLAIYAAAKEHSIKSDFELFKQEISKRNVHGYSLETHGETYSRIRALCSGLDNAIQHFAPMFGFGTIIDNTLAPVTDQQRKDFRPEFIDRRRKMKVTVVGMALTPSQAKIEWPQEPKAAADTARAFAEHSQFIGDCTGNLVLVNGRLEVIKSVLNGQSEGPDNKEVEGWRAKCGVGARTGWKVGG